jgi:hypothetical protein
MMKKPTFFAINQMAAGICVALVLAATGAAQGFTPVGGTAMHFCLPTQLGPCLIQPIAVGPNANGSTVGDPWVLGTAQTSAGNYYLYHWVNGTWVYTGGAGVQISVSPQGNPWVITANGDIYYWNGSTFLQASGAGCANEIGVGPKANGSPYGTPWIIGCNSQWGAKNGTVYQLQGTNWVPQPGAGVQIAVSPQAVPWIADVDGNVSYWNGSSFSSVPKPPQYNPGIAFVESIAVGPSTAPFAGPYGDVWIIDAHPNPLIYQLQYGTKWVEISGNAWGAGVMSVSPDFGVPWFVSDTGQIAYMCSPGLRTPPCTD